MAFTKVVDYQEIKDWLANDKISGIKGYNEDLLHIFSDNVLKMIKNGDDGWQALVPKEVENAVTSKKLFGFKVSQ